MVSVPLPTPPRPVFGRGGWGVRACLTLTECPRGPQRRKAAEAPKLGTKRRQMGLKSGCPAVSPAAHRFQQIGSPTSRGPQGAINARRSDAPPRERGSLEMCRQRQRKTTAGGGARAIIGAVAVLSALGVPQRASAMPIPFVYAGIIVIPDPQIPMSGLSQPF
jgi:hypothetical protein